MAQVIGKDTQLSDPTMMTYHSDGTAEFLRRNKGAFYDYMETIYTPLFAGGLIFLIFIIPLLYLNVGLWEYHYKYYPNMTDSQFNDMYSSVGITVFTGDNNLINNQELINLSNDSAHIMIGLMIFFFLYSIFLYYLNRYHSVVYQRAIRENWYILICPLGWLIRKAIQRRGYAFEKSGPHPNKALNFFVGPPVCTEMILDKDYKTKLDSIEWKKVDRFQKPSYYKTLSYKEKIKWNKERKFRCRKVTLYFTEPPKEGSVKVIVS